MDSFLALCAYTLPLFCDSCSFAFDTWDNCLERTAEHEKIILDPQHLYITSSKMWLDKKATKNCSSFIDEYHLGLYMMIESMRYKVPKHRLWLFYEYGVKSIVMRVSNIRYVIQKWWENNADYYESPQCILLNSA